MVMVIKNKVFKLAVISLTASMFMLALAVAGLGIFIHEWNQHTAMLSGKAPLIVISTMHGYGPGVMLGGVTGFLLFLLYFFYRCLFRKETAFFRMSEKTLAVLMLLSLAVIFVGNYLIASHWRNQAVNGGYTQCPITTLLTNRLTMEVWALNESLCYDNEIRHIVKRGTVDEMRQVEQYLVARQKQQDARLRVLQQEEEIKQRRRKSDG